MTQQPAPTANQQSKERPKFVTFKMRCGRTVTVPDTPQYRSSAQRMGWVEVRST